MAVYRAQPGLTYRHSTKNLFSSTKRNQTLTDDWYNTVAVVGFVATRGSANAAAVADTSIP
jgi:hypothetical protein